MHVTCEVLSAANPRDAPVRRVTLSDQKLIPPVTKGSRAWLADSSSRLSPAPVRYGRANRAPGPSPSGRRRRQSAAGRRGGPYVTVLALSGTGEHRCHIDVPRTA